MVEILQTIPNIYIYILEIHIIGGGGGISYR